MSNSIMDAFNEAIRFTTGYMGYQTQKNNEQNQLEIDVFNASFQTNIQNYLRDNPYLGGLSEEDDQRAFNDYLGKLDYFVEEQYANARRTNNSQNYRQMMDRMRVQSLEANRNYALGKQDEWRISREAASLLEDNRRYIEAGWSPEETVRAINNRLALSATIQPILPEQMENMKRYYERAVYENYVGGALGRANDVNDLEGILREAQSAFGFLPPLAVNTYDEDGNVIGTQELPWSFEGKKDWEDHRIEEETKRIRGEHFEFYQDKNSEFERAVISGNYDLAESIARQYGAAWNRYWNPNNREHLNSDAAYRDRGSHWFDLGKLNAYRELGEAEAGIRFLAEYNLEMFTQPQLDGHGNVIVGYNADGKPIIENYDSFAAALQGFLSYKRKAFFMSNGGEDAYTLQMWEAEQAVWFERWWDEVERAVRQKSPTLADDFRRGREFSTYTTAGGAYYESLSSSDQRYIRGLSDEQRTLFEERCVNFYTTLFMNRTFDGITDVSEIRRIMRDFTAREIESYLRWSSTPRELGQKYIQLMEFSNRAMDGRADDIIWIDYNPRRLGAAGGTYMFRDTNAQLAVEAVRQEEQSIIAGIFGIERDLLQPSWMRSKLRNNDVIPKGMFKIESGQHAGTYYLGYDNNANPIVMRQNAQGGWGEYRREERRLTQAERIQQSQINWNNLVETINNNINPITGEAFNYGTNPPPTIGNSTAWNPNNYGAQSWSAYFQRLKDEPALLTSVINSGKHPFTGASFSYRTNPPPGSGIPANLPAGVSSNRPTWESMGAGERLQVWVEHFERQLGRR